MLNMRPDRRSLSEQLRDGIKEYIHSQNMQAGDRLPSESEFASMFGVSRATVREALTNLEEERLIVCKHGVGRFLASDLEDMLSEEITRLQSVTEMAQALGIEVSTKVLSFRQEPASDVVQNRLDLPEGSLVYVLERARLAQNQVIIYSIDIFPAYLVAGNLREADFTGSLVEIMEGKWNTRLSYSKAIISATLLSKELNQRLGIKANIPWILMEQVNFDDNDQPILYSQDYHRSDKFQFRVVRRRR